MSIVTRSSIAKENKEFNKIETNQSSENIELTGLDNAFHENIKNTVLEHNPESELNLKMSVTDIDTTSRQTTSRSSKRPISQRSTSEKKLSSTSSNSKKVKFEENDAGINHVDNFFQQEIQRLIASPAHFAFQPVCHVCEVFKDDGNIVRCTGICLRYFHRDCLKYPPEYLIPLGANFQCLDCWTNTYRCILCGAPDKITSLIHCETPDCGRLYHKSCLENSNLMSVNATADSILSCPAHYCVTCAREDRSSIQKPHTKLIQCIRCPVAFHDADLCTAAGSVELSLSHVVCPRHFEKDLIKMSLYKPYHPDWCFKCFKPDVKLLCQYCPSSYHTECLNNSRKKGDKQDAVFLCPDCRNYRQPRYGEIVFIKASQYRWWPSEIIHPRNAPMNILRMKRPDGTFPILFLGSQEYQWVARSRSISYNIASQSSIVKDTGGSLKMDKDFTFGLQRAAAMHKIFVNIVLKHVPLKSITADAMSKKDLSPYVNFKEQSRKTTKFEGIKSNVLVSPAKLPLRKNQTMCHCVDRCQISVCRNYLNKMECDTDICLNKEQCDNCLFTNYVKKNVGVSKTSNRGFGLKTIDALNENEFVIEFVGEIITRSMSTTRINMAKCKNVRDFYMIRLSGDLVVDAGPKGNLSRFINHSCDPNCRVERWTVDGHTRLGIFAARDIGSGEELSLDYRLSGYILKEDIFCLCNSQNCSGFLGPERVANIIAARSPTVSPVKKESSSVVDASEKKEPSRVNDTGDIGVTKEAIVQSQGKDVIEGTLECRDFVVRIADDTHSHMIESTNNIVEGMGTDCNISIAIEEDAGSLKEDAHRKKECLREILEKNIRDKETAKKTELSTLNTDSVNLGVLVKGANVVKTRRRKSGSVKICPKTNDSDYAPSKKESLVKEYPKKVDPVRTSNRRVSKKKEVATTSELVEIDPKLLIVVNDLPLMEDPIDTPEVSIDENKHPVKSDPIDNPEVSIDTGNEHSVKTDPIATPEVSINTENEHPVKTDPIATPEVSINTEKEHPVKTDPIATTEVSIDTGNEHSVKTDPIATPEVSIDTGNEHSVKTDPIATPEVSIDTENEHPVKTDPIATLEVSINTENEHPVKTDPIATTEVSIDTENEHPVKRDPISMCPIISDRPTEACPIEEDRHENLATDSRSTVTLMDRNVFTAVSSNLVDPPKEDYMAISVEKESVAEAVPIEDPHKENKPAQVCEKKTNTVIEALTESNVSAWTPNVDVSRRDKTEHRSIKESSLRTTVTVMTKNDTVNRINSDTIQGDPIKKEFVHESYCFRCFDGGQLVLCDKRGCTKTYHLSCIGMRKAPLGTWYCPWHFCNNCGEPSDLFCVQCPSSYCQAHLEVNKMTPSASGSILSLCGYHRHDNTAAAGLMSHDVEKTEN